MDVNYHVSFKLPHSDGIEKLASAQSGILTWKRLLTSMGYPDTADSCSQGEPIGEPVSGDI